MQLNKKFKRIINYGVGPIVMIWLFFSLKHQISQQKNLPEITQFISQNFHQPHFIIYSSCLLLIAFVNFGIEAYKWQILVKDIQPIKFFRAFKATLSGQSIAFNTVNNVGAYLGRIMYLDDGNRLRAIAVTLIGSLSLLIVALLFGILGLVYLRFSILQSSNQFVGLSKYWIDGLICIVLFTSIALLVFFYEISIIVKVIERLPFVKKYVYFINKLEKFDVKKLNKILILSIFRYFTFIVQYLIAFKIFGVHGSLFELGCLVSVMFLILAIIPSLAFAELGIRGEVSHILFSLVSSNALGIALSALTIWLISKVFPALAGSLFLAGVKLFKSKKYEKV